MVARTTTPLPSLYLDDETAWLEEMARLASEKRTAEMDLDSLSEYLGDMARRDRRAVYNRLVVLLTHLLKWDHQPERRSSSWSGSILAQQRKLRQLVESGTLRRHAAAVLADAYQDARAEAAAQTDLLVDSFPAECIQSIDDLLARQDKTGSPDS